MRQTWVADLLFTSGGVAIVAGCYWVFPPAALILSGAALCGYALLIGSRTRHDR